jgi:hypothetical protein
MNDEEFLAYMEAKSVEPTALFLVGEIRRLLVLADEPDPRPTARDDERFTLIPRIVEMFVARARRLRKSTEVDRLLMLVAKIDELAQTAAQDANKQTDENRALYTNGVARGLRQAADLFRS